MSKAMNELKRLLGAEPRIEEGIEVLNRADEKQQEYTAPTEPGTEEVEQAVVSVTDKTDVVDVTSLAQAREVARRTRGLPAMLSKQEFNTRFLLATQPYIPKVALALIRECREDIELFGLEYAQRKWARFTELKKEGGQTNETGPVQL